MKIAARQKALSKFYENLALSSEDSRYYISPTGIEKQDLAQMNYCELIEKYKIVDAHLHSFSEAQFINLLEEEGFRTGKIDYTHTYSPKHSLWAALNIRGI